MIKILYIVSTLKRSGPTSQLYNLIRHLDRGHFEPYLVTLSSEPSDSRWNEFEPLDVKLCSLDLARFESLFCAKKRLQSVFRDWRPDVIQTQGIRADSILASLRQDVPWVMTSRNYPPEDYPTKFGWLKGALMVRQHLHAMRRCRNLVSCSKTIQRKLAAVDIEGQAIENGVEVSEVSVIGSNFSLNFPKPIFVSVGSLIPRKNMHLLVEGFRSLPDSEKGSLVILGDGPLMESLQAKACSRVHLLGNVDNVADYLAGSDCFVSASLSEGLPNTVLEALASGLPVVLSDIESHEEIAAKCTKACKVFSLQDGADALSKAMCSSINDFDNSWRSEARNAVRYNFSAEGMSARYQMLYKNILGV